METTGKSKTKDAFFPALFLIPLPLPILFLTIRNSFQRDGVLRKCNPFFSIFQLFSLFSMQMRRKSSADKFNRKMRPPTFTPSCVNC